MLSLCIIIITVLHVNAIRRDVVIANLVGLLYEEAETSLAEKQKAEGVCVGKDS